MATEVLGVSWKGSQTSVFLIPVKVQLKVVVCIFIIPVLGMVFLVLVVCNTSLQPTKEGTKLPGGCAADGNKQLGMVFGEVAVVLRIVEKLHY